MYVMRKRNYTDSVKGFFLEIGDSVLRLCVGIKLLSLDCDKYLHDKDRSTTSSNLVERYAIYWNIKYVN